MFRKKFSHITFLHIYHHALSFSVGWYTARYYPGELSTTNGSIKINVNLFKNIFSLFINSPNLLFQLYSVGGPASVFAVWNNFVHLSMYLYYFASANSSLRPYAVRYKKRITQLQLVSKLLQIFESFCTDRIPKKFFVLFPFLQT